MDQNWEMFETVSKRLKALFSNQTRNGVNTANVVSTALSVIAWALGCIKHPMALFINWLSYGATNASRAEDHFNVSESENLQTTSFCLPSFVILSPRASISRNRACLRYVFGGHYFRNIDVRQSRLRLVS